MSKKLNADKKKARLENEIAIIINLLNNAVQPITREQFRVMTGWTDSHIRKIIKEARNNGYPIVAHNRAKGYYLAKTERDRQLLLREYLSKATSMLRTYWTLLKGRECDGQISLEDLIKELPQEDM